MAGAARDEEPPPERCRREVAASRTAADRLELVSRVAVCAGTVVAAAVAVLLASGGLELSAALDWLGSSSSPSSWPGSAATSRPGACA